MDMSPHPDTIGIGIYVPPGHPNPAKGTGWPGTTPRPSLSRASNAADEQVGSEHYGGSPPAWIARVAFSD